MCFIKKILLSITLVNLMLQTSYIIGFKPGDRVKLECSKYGLKMVECDRKLNHSKERVPADLLEFPHMAVIGFIEEGNDEINWNCGGTLISPLWILTAAHCASDPSLGPAKVVAVGTSTFEEEEYEDLTQTRNITKIIKHPLYQPPSKYNDIGLLKMNFPINVSRDVRIACLNTNEKIPSLAIASGFGKTSYDNFRGSRSLMHVDLDIISNEKCNISLKKMVKRNLRKGIISSQMCAGDLIKGGKDTCQGDSGGPLQTIIEDPDCINTFPLYVVLGVTSFGRFCGYKNSPGVYTRVSEFISWIEDIVWPIANFE